MRIKWLIFTLAGAVLLSGCDRNTIGVDTPDVLPDWVEVETYAGGELGTTFNVSASAFEDPAPAVEVR